MRRFCFSILFIFLCGVVLIPQVSEPQSSGSVCGYCNHAMDEPVHIIEWYDRFHCPEGAHNYDIFLEFTTGHTGGCGYLFSLEGDKTCWIHPPCSTCLFLYDDRVHWWTGYRITSCPGEDGVLQTDDDHTWSEFLDSVGPISGSCSTSYFYDWENPGSCEFHD